MSKAVAVEGDTKVVTSTAKHPTDIDKKGAWTAGNLEVTLGEKISVGEKKVELSAKMTWNYLGGSANNIPTPPVTDIAELIAAPTKLKDKNQNILVESDEVTGTLDSGNKIIVTNSQKILKTD